jgi:rhodanese-related sulfurtransferase
MKAIPASLFAAWLAFAAFPAAADEAKHVQAKDAPALIEQVKPVIVDVRTAEEFQDGHLAGARNLDVNDPGFEAAVAALDRDQPYLLHCQAGGRSRKALAVFQKLGFRNLIHLDDGYAGWEDASLPVTKE